MTRTRKYSFAISVGLRVDRGRVRRPFAREGGVSRDLLPHGPSIDLCLHAGCKRPEIAAVFPCAYVAGPLKRNLRHLFLLLGTRKPCVGSNTHMLHGAEILHHLAIVAHNAVRQTRRGSFLDGSQVPRTIGARQVLEPRQGRPPAPPRTSM